MNLATFLALGRVSNLPTVWTNVIAGAVIAGASPTLSGLVMVSAALSLFYCGGMFLNDAFDRHTDAIERPERPIPSGQVLANAVFINGFVQLGAGLVLLTTAASLHSPAATSAFTAGLALAATIVAYDAWHSGNRFAPWLMGLCRALVYVCAATALTAEPRWPALLAAGLLLTAYTAGITMVAGKEQPTRSHRSHVAVLIAGICLVDAAWVSVNGRHALALLCAGGLPLVLYAHGRVAGT